MKGFVKKSMSTVLAFAMAASLVAVAPTSVEAASSKYVKSLKVSKSSVSVTEGKKVTVKATVAVKGSAKKNVTVKSSKTGVATVKVGSPDKKGVSKVTITGKKKGSAKITVKTKAKNNKGKYLSKTISVSVKAKTTEAPTTEDKPTDPTTEEKPTDPTTEEKPTDPVVEPDFKIRSDVNGEKATASLTKDVPLITLSTNAYLKGDNPVYVWYKDGKKLTKDSLKYVTKIVVNQAQLDIFEPGEYYLKITKEVSEWDADLRDTVTKSVEYTSSTITVTSDVEKPATDEVKWTVEKSTFEKEWSYKDEATGEEYLYPICLKRELVSFNPWPTTVEQVEYVIKNCNDPFVIGALYVVAMDNYNFKEGQANIKKRGITSMLMTNALATGAFIPGLSVETYGVQPTEVEAIQTQGYNELGILAPVGSQLIGSPTTDKENGYVYQYAPRTYCYGATAENGYAPNGNPEDINDKTKWKIVVDQYPYCFDQVAGASYVDVDPDVKKEGTVEYKKKAKGSDTYETLTDDWSNMPALHKDPKFITVCPEHYVLHKETESSPLTVSEHNQLIRVGLVWSENSKRWVAADYAGLNSATHAAPGLPSHYNYQGQGLFSNNYVAPAVKSGF